MVNGLRPLTVALDDSPQDPESESGSEFSQTTGLEKAFLEKAMLEPPVAVPLAEKSVEDEPLAGSPGFRSNRSLASSKLSSRRRLHNPPIRELEGQLAGPCDLT